VSERVTTRDVEAALRRAADVVENLLQREPDSVRAVLTGEAQRWREMAASPWVEVDPSANER